MRKLLWALSLIGLLVFGCVATGPGGKKSLILIPTSQEVAIGVGMAEEINRSEMAFPDSVWQNYLTEVGQKIVDVCDRKDIEYHFTVIESDQINAFATPGGYVYFYTGLLREMRNEAEMAAVMAHEISHIVARYGIKRLQKALGVAAAYELAFGGKQSKVIDAAASLGLGLIFAGYSRENEREADSFGITYMVRADYHPEGMVGMFEVLATLGDSGHSGVFDRLASSHPETQERIRNAKAQIASIKLLSADLIFGENRYQQMLKRLPNPKNVSTTTL